MTVATRTGDGTLNRFTLKITETSAKWKTILSTG